MTKENYKAILVLTWTALLCFLAGKEHQKKEAVPVDKVMVQEYLDSLLIDKRNRDSAYIEYCDPATRVAFKYWLQQEKEQINQDTSILALN